MKPAWCLCGSPLTCRCGARIVAWRGAWYWVRLVSAQTCPIKPVSRLFPGAVTRRKDLGGTQLPAGAGKRHGVFQTV
jgi:hypothetical protein